MSLGDIESFGMPMLICKPSLQEVLIFFQHQALGSQKLH